MDRRLRRFYSFKLKIDLALYDELRLAYRRPVQRDDDWKYDPSYYDNDELDWARENADPDIGDR